MRLVASLTRVSDHSHLPSSRQAPKVTVWYDGACPLCLREIALMRRLDKSKRIAFVDISKDTPEDCPIDQADLLARFHAKEDGVVLSGAAAFAAMWRAIPVLRPLGLLARNRAILRILEKLYVIFLRHRPKLQRLVAGGS
ncbi:thiol-disulfide oxidoreductase DCC family protein [Erythrobacter sp. HA6-11]